MTFRHLVVPCLVGLLTVSTLSAQDTPGAAGVPLPAVPEDNSASTLVIRPAQVTLIEDVDIPAREAGPILNLEVREGDIVDIGQLLGKLDDTKAQIERRAAEKEHSLKSEEANNDIDYRFALAARLVEAKELERMYTVNSRLTGTISKTEIEKQELTVERTKLQAEQAQHDMKLAAMQADRAAVDIDAAEEAIHRHQVISPVKGLVVKRFKDRGEWVNPGDTVLRVLRLDRLRVEGYLGTEHYSQTLIGRPATFTIEVAGQGPQAFVGTVTFVEPEVQPVTKRFKVWAEIDNNELKLTPGMSGTLTVEFKADGADNTRVGRLPQG